MEDFTHFDDKGGARMVDVSEKADTLRLARACARVYADAHTLELIKTGGIKKGDVLAVARVAGIMAAKRTSDIIPLCHPIALAGVEVALEVNDRDLCVEILAAARCTGPTGVEMEALTAASVAALTVYDMCKAVRRDMTIGDIKLLEKSGGRSGHFLRGDDNG